MDKIVEKSMKKAKIEVSLRGFLRTFINIVLKTLLIISAAWLLWVKTTSFVAILWAAWLAIWLALQWSLANFAGWVLILLFKPYLIWDFIKSQWEIGTVKEISIFTTSIVTPEHRLVIIPNWPLANWNITNFTKEDMARVDIRVWVSYNADLKITKRIIQDILDSHKNILKDPKATVNVLELWDSSVNLAIRPYCKPEHYRTVYFEVIEDIKIALDKNNIEIPFPQTVVHMKK